MDEAALIEFLKKRLVITTTKKYGSFGDSDYVEIQLGLRMEEYGPIEHISSDTIDLPRMES